MHITKTFSLLFIAALFASCGTAEKKEVDATVDSQPEVKTEEIHSYSINTEKSKVMWRGSILSVKAHEGTLNFESGKFSAKGDELIDGTFVVDMASIVPTDDNFKPAEGKTKEALVGHLSSADFFDVATFPKSILSIVDGNATLTVRGHAKGVELRNVTVNSNGDNVTASAEYSFSRKAFGVDSSNITDYAISDEITVRVDINGVKY